MRNKRLLAASSLGLLLVLGCQMFGPSPLVLRGLTPEQARDKIRALKATHTFPQEGVVVELEGTYAYPKSTFILNEQDGGESATSRVTYRAVGDGAAFVGAYAIPLADFQPITDSSVSARLHPDAIGHVLVYDLKKLGLTALKPVPDEHRSWDGMEFFVGDVPCTLARYPNKGWLTFGKDDVVDSGIDLNDTKVSEFGKPLRGGCFHYAADEKRPAAWNPATGIWLHGFWCMDWASDSLKVAAIDPDLHTFTLKGIHYLGIGPAQHTAHQPRRYYAYNLLEELDIPGEWYVDRTDLKLYYYPRTGESGTALLVDHAEPIVYVHNAKHLTLEGLSFKFNTTPALSVSHVQDVVLDNLSASYTTRDGMEVSYANDCLIRNCKTFMTGGDGLQLHDCGDRKTLTPSHTRITGCDFSRPGRLNSTARCARMSGVGLQIDHNYFHDAPYIGLTYTGNDNIIESNEVAFVMMESGDGGGFYTGRDWTSQGNILRWNYLHHFGASGVKYKRDHGQPLFCEPLVRDDSSGIYLDDCDAGDMCVSNHIVGTGRGFLIGGGRDNLIADNLIEDCGICAVHLDARGLKRLRIGRGGSWDMKAKLEAVDYLNPPWSVRYPWMADYLTNDPLLPVRTKIVNNKAIRCKQFMGGHLYGRPNLLSEFNITNNNVSVEETK